MKGMEGTEALAVEDPDFGAVLLPNVAKLWEGSEFVDCTIVCKNGMVQAHKVVLAASCKYFHDLFVSAPLPTPCSHPMIFLKRWKLNEVHAVLQFMYTGNTVIAPSQLPDVIKICGELEYKILPQRLKGCVEERNNRIQNMQRNVTSFQVQDNRMSQANNENNGIDEPEQGEQFLQEGDVSVPEGHPQDETQPDSNAEYVHDQEEYPVQATLRHLINLNNEGMKKKRRPGPKNLAKAVKTMISEQQIFSHSSSSESMQFSNGDVKYEVLDNGDEEGQDEDAEDQGTLGLLNPQEWLEVTQDDGTGADNMDALSSQSLAMFQKNSPQHRPFGCQFCESSFARSAHLKRHMRIHTGEKPFECHLCNRAFARQDKLKGHMDRHAQQNNRLQELFVSNSTQLSRLPKSSKNEPGSLMMENGNGSSGMISNDLSISVIPSPESTANGNGVSLGQPKRETVTSSAATSSSSYFDIHPLLTKGAGNMFTGS